MHNKHEDIKNILNKSRKLLNKVSLTEENEIKRRYNMILEQEGSGEEVYEKPDVGKQIERNIEKDEEGDAEKTKREKQQGYRISGGILYIHGQESSDL